MTIKEIIINSIRNPKDDQIKKEILAAVATPAEIAKEFNKNPTTINNLIEKENIDSIKVGRISLALKSDFYNMFNKDIDEYKDESKELESAIFALILKPYNKELIVKQGCEIGFNLLTQFNVDNISQKRVQDFKEESITIPVSMDYAKEFNAATKGFENGNTFNIEITDEEISKYIEIYKKTFTDEIILEYTFNQDKFLKDFKENNFKLAKNDFFSITFKASNIAIIEEDNIKESCTYFISSPGCNVGLDLLEKFNLTSYEVSNKFIDPISIKEYTLYINEETAIKYKNKYGYFQDTNKLIVNCKTDEFYSCVDLEFNKGIINYKINNNKVLSVWDSLDNKLEIISNEMSDIETKVRLYKEELRLIENDKKEYADKAAALIREWIKDNGSNELNLNLEYKKDINEMFVEEFMKANNIEFLFNEDVDFDIDTNAVISQDILTKVDTLLSPISEYVYSFETVGVVPLEEFNGGSVYAVITMINKLKVYIEIFNDSMD